MFQAQPQAQPTTTRARSAVDAVDRTTCFPINDSQTRQYLVSARVWLSRFHHFQADSRKAFGSAVVSQSVMTPSAIHWAWSPRRASSAPSMGTKRRPRIKIFDDDDSGDELPSSPGEGLRLEAPSTTRRLKDEARHCIPRRDRVAISPSASTSSSIFVLVVDSDRAHGARPARNVRAHSRLGLASEPPANTLSHASETSSKVGLFVTVRGVGGGDDDESSGESREGSTFTSSFCATTFRGGDGKDGAFSRATDGDGSSSVLFRGVNERLRVRNAIRFFFFVVRGVELERAANGGRGHHPFGILSQGASRVRREQAKPSSGATHQKNRATLSTPDDRPVVALRSFA
mmetsp:Transcript_14894/g.48589  ORF Transcript_14894/g.48589 Transcript_14894/m.48589 type:complete len:345 (-) Transcript_14894:94-1128(-)